MKSLPIPALLLSALALPSCVIHIGGDGDGIHWGHSRGLRGSGVRVEETRDVEPFTAVHLATMGDTNIVVGEETSLRLSGDDNLLPKIETEVEDGRLVIRLPGESRPRARLRVHITTPSLERVDLSGSGNLEISGASGERLSLNLAGSGDIEARGQVGHVAANINGSGDISLKELRAQEASVRVSGSGDIDVYASENLEYAISGSGDILIYGNPRLRGQVSGSGSIRHR